MRLFLSIFCYWLLYSCHSNVTLDNDLKLQYGKSAEYWESTLPLGNGRLGMMPNGGILDEKIILNDISMWSGSQEDALDKKALSYLPKIQELLKKGQNIAAQELMYKHFKCKGQGSAFGQGLNAPYGCFQILGSLDIRYKYSDASAAVQGYQFGLNISKANAYTNFIKNNIKFKREYFVSQANDVMLIRISADKENAISLDLKLNRPERADFFVENDDICMKGQLNDGNNDTNGIQFYTKLHVVNTGGEKNTTPDNAIAVKNADEVLIFISSATDFLFENHQATVDSLLTEATAHSYRNLVASHQTQYQEKFSRVTLQLKGKNTAGNIPQRLKDFQTNYDPALVALYFQYGRYLMISGTRENSMPLNLQGLWANSLQTPWNGDYHLNINVQMNYWQTEVCNLSELHKPLIAFTKSLVPSGEKTAKAYYGAEGWVAHVISNPWLFTAPGEHASWGATNTGGAWLCRHLWEHYAFTQDKNYLASVFPTMQNAAQFFINTMIEEPKTGWLVTAPTSSPENSFYLPGSNKPAYVCMGATMDAQIIRELFQNTLKAVQILGNTNEITRKIEEALPLLPPTQISPNGYVQEWLEDYKEVDIYHRHISHLYGLYPSNQITPSQTPKLAEAAKVTLNRRGDEGTGWSRAWKINFWARLYDGNRAYSLLKNLLNPVSLKKTEHSERGGTYPNLFCAHPPFQIDGNLGGTAGIAEMLLQSHEGYLHLLPAIPNHWKEGKFEGLRARGGITVGAEWKEKKLQKITLLATADNDFRIKIPEYVQRLSIDNKDVKTAPFLTINLKKGEQKILKFNR